MKTGLIVILMSFLLLANGQRFFQKSYEYDSGSNRAVQGRQGFDTNAKFQIPYQLVSGVQIAKQVPYVEILKLVESFIKLKGELAGRAWDLIYDNAHIFSAVRDVLISKISTIHSLSLNAIIILRKVLEFAATLFSNVSVNFGSDASLSFGK